MADLLGPHAKVKEKASPSSPPLQEEIKRLESHEISAITRPSLQETIPALE
jgi:hypothetical protein